MPVHGFGISLRYDSIVQDPVARILTPIFTQKFSLWSAMRVWLLQIPGVQGVVVVALIVLAAWLSIGGHTRLESTSATADGTEVLMNSVSVSNATLLPFTKTIIIQFSFSFPFSSYLLPLWQ